MFEQDGSVRYLCRYRADNGVWINEWLPGSELIGDPEFNQDTGSYDTDDESELAER